MITYFFQRKRTENDITIQIKLIKLLKKWNIIFITSFQLINLSYYTQFLSLYKIRGFVVFLPAQLKKNYKAVKKLYKIFESQKLLCKMNKFLDEILNLGPINKRKSLSQRNSDLKQKEQESIKKSQIENFDDKRSPSNYSNQNDEYQIQQVTQQVVFDDVVQSPKNPLYIHHLRNTHSLPQQNHQKNQELNQQLNPIPDQDYVFDHFESQNNKFNSKFKNQKYSFKNDEEFQSPSNPNNYKNRQEDNQCLNQNNNNENYVQGDFKKLKRLNQMTVQNLISGINEAKQAQRRFERWFIDQKQEFSVLIQQTIKLIIQKINSTIFPTSHPNQQKDPKQAQIQNISQSPLSMQRKWQIQKKLIKEQLQQRYQYRIEKLQQELQEQRNFAQQRLNQYIKQNANPSLLNNQFCQKPNNIGQPNNYVLQQLQFVKKQLQQKQSIINQMQIQNQKLNQHIFDIEQKIQGIELQVQIRVRDKLKDLQSQSTNNLNGSKQNLQIKNQILLHPILEASSHLEQSSKLFGLQQSMNIKSQKVVEQLKKQNDQLKLIIQRLQQQINKAKYEIKTLQQQNLFRQTQIKQRQKIVQFRQLNIKKTEQDIDYQWSQVERQKQSFVMRQQQLTMAQQNISHKITELRSKQVELEKWNSQLNKRQANINYREQQTQKNLEQLVMRQNQMKTRERQRQNLIKVQRESYSNSNQNINIRSKKNIHAHDLSSNIQGSFRPSNDVQIPNLPIGKKYHPDYQINKTYDNQYQFKNRQILKHNVQKSFEDLDRSYGKIKDKQRQKTSVTANNFRSGRTNQNIHQFVLPQTSKGGHHSRSKSRSKQKNLIRNFNPNSIGSTNSISSGYKNGGFKGNKYMQQLYNNKQHSNLDGLGSKLQRLRDEIKRQIDSIK